MNNITRIYNQFRQSPMSILTKRFNIPSNLNLNDPSAIIQYLLNTGQVSQQQVNNVVNMSSSNPMIRQIMKNTK